MEQYWDTPADRGYHAFLEDGGTALLTRHGGGEQLCWHRHVSAYAALVLEGGYLEAGDRGRFAVQPGDVVIHGPYESHQDRFSSRGAVVLNLQLDQHKP